MLSEKKIKSANILVVDDDQNSRDTIKFIFNAFEPGFNIETLGNPLDIKNFLKNNIPDLIISDWEMPEMNGIELIRYVRSLPQLNFTPIIMATGIMTAGENLMIALNAGANDFIRKPFDKTELIARVQSMLQISNSMKEIQGQNNAINEYHRFVVSLIASVPIPLVYYNIEGKILNCNNSFLEIFELTAENVIGKIVYELCPNFQVMKQQTEKMIKEKSKQLRFESVISLPNKTNVTFLITKTIFYNPFEIAEGIVCVMSDITELKEIHKKSIDEKKRELVSSAMRMINMSEIIDRLMLDLDTLNSHVDAKGKAFLKGLINKYNLKSIDSTWREFEMRFEQVYEEFYQRLVVVHPNITPNEKKLSALLRLNLTSKEIAAITFQDAKSVDMARYRLRKKLNLGQDENLVDYLMKI